MKEMRNGTEDYEAVQQASDLEEPGTEDEPEPAGCGLVQTMKSRPNFCCSVFGAMCAVMVCATVLSLHTPAAYRTVQKTATTQSSDINRPFEDDDSDYQYHQKNTLAVSSAGLSSGYEVYFQDAGVTDEDESAPKDAGTTDFPEMPTATAHCASYTQGAKPTDEIFCASPWGEPTGKGQKCSRSDGTCPKNLKKVTSAKSPEPDEDAPCLCGFDIDRTLTAKQAFAASSTGVVRGPRKSNCPDTTSIPNSYDWAFGGGQQTLSAMSSVGVASTACAKCYVAITSRGWAQGTTKQNRATLLKAITTPPFAKLAEKHPDAMKWTNGARSWTKSQTDLAGFAKNGYGPGRIHSPLVVWQYDKLKQWAIEGVLEWYASKGILIPRERVWFFDDRADNVQYFNGTGMNGRQISCAARDGGNVGLCGARPEEIELKPGITLCGKESSSSHGHSGKKR